MPVETVSIQTVDTLPQTRPIRSLSLRSNFSWTFVGNIVYTLSQWGMISLLAKLGSTAMVGQFALSLAITAPIMLFANLQLRGVQATDANHEYNFLDYLGLRLVTTFLASIAIVVILLALGYRGELAFSILLMGLAKAVESISDIIYGLLQQYERMDRIAKSMIIKGCSSVSALWLGLYLTGSVVWAVAGLALTWTIVLLSYDLRSCVQILQLGSFGAASITRSSLLAFRSHLKAAKLLKLVWLALPLGTMVLFSSLTVNVPRYFLQHYGGASSVGIFSALAYLMQVDNTIIGALGQSASPRLAKYYAAKNKHAFCGLMMKLILIGFILGGIVFLVAIFGGQRIITWLYKSEYARYNSTFIILMIASWISDVAGFLGYGITAARRFAIQAPLNLCVTVVTTIACALLISHYGLKGAAMANVLGITTLLVGCGLILWNVVASLDKSA